jgi:hypothetical protein
MERALALPRLPRRGTLALSRLVGWPAVWGLVAVSTAGRLLVGLRRQTPAYFPDEYMYAELGRSLAADGRPLVRGLESDFPALLQPLLTAPAWLVGDVATAYHLVQVLNCAALSLAAIPVYVLARRIGIGERAAVLVVALSLLAPALLYGGWVVSEPIAYPLVAVSLLLGVRALERPGAGAAGAFLLAAGLAGFARAQLLVLPLCFLAGALIVGVRERRLARAVREQALVVGVVTLAGAAFLVRGGNRLGLYGELLALDLEPRALVARLATQALALLYASGWVIVPGALLGLGLALWRPLSRAELAFGALTLSLAAALLLQAALWGDTALMQERYTFYAAPALTTAFALFAVRGWPWRRVHAVSCGALLLIAATVPLSGYVTQFGNRHAPVLFAVAYVEQLTGDVGSGSLLVAAAAGALALLAALAGLRARPLVLVGALATIALAATSLCANLYDLRKNDAIRAAYLPANPSWVDDAGIGETALVYAPGHYKDGLEQLFWNRSVRSVLLLPDAEPLDSFAADRVTIRADGALLRAGRPVRTPLLVDSRAAAITLTGADVVGSSPAYDLWRPRGTPRLATYAVGWYRDGWLGSSGTFTTWAPRVAGRVRFQLRGPSDAPASTLSIESPAGRRSLVVPPGETRTVELAACGHGSWQATVASNTVVFAADRVLTVRSTRPVWTPDPAACR